ncbi:small subunit ribosomal protein S15 [Candidatus Methanophagaceae archaeon]|jgi:small subunit ribosomal protein S15|nr:small subunit ribosomal protein S15 [Methanophagales archaeon]
MARMYARRRGKSGSKRSRIRRTETPEWVDLSAEEVETKVVTLYNQGLSTSEIGIELRDSYGMPCVAHVTGKKMTGILKEQNVAPEIPEDLQNLMRKALRVRKHIELNKKDVHNKRALQLTESKIRRLVKYYRREKVLAMDWRYKPEIAEFVLRR